MTWPIRALRWLLQAVFAEHEYTELVVCPNLNHVVVFSAPHRMSDDDVKHKLAEHVRSERETMDANGVIV